MTGKSDNDLKAQAEAALAKYIEDGKLTTNARIISIGDSDGIVVADIPVQADSSKYVHLFAFADLTDWISGKNEQLAAPYWEKSHNTFTMSELRGAVRFGVAAGLVSAVDALGVLGEDENE